MGFTFLELDQKLYLSYIKGMKKLLLLLSLFFPLTTTAETPTIGVGYYSIQNKTFPCERALRVFDGVKRPALMFLWSTFGDDLSCVKKFLALPQKKKEVYIHISNECCRRNITCKKGELLKDVPVWKLNSNIEKSDPKTKQAYVKRLNKILNFVKEYNEDVTWYISTGLEDNYSFKAKKKVYNWLKNAKINHETNERVKIYVNPLNRTCVNTKCEIHDKKTGTNNHWLYIPDGYCVKPFDACKTNVMTQDELLAKLLKQKKNNNKFFVWWSEQQGRYGESPKRALAPRKRTIKITDGQIRDANALLKKGNN